MRIETKKSGVFRDTHSKGLTMKNGEAYQLHLKERRAETRLDTLESKMDRLLEIMEKNNGIT